MSDEIPTAEDFANMVLREFEGDTRVVTVEMLARAYSTMFAQQESVMSLFALVAKIKPHLMFEDRFTGIQGEIIASSQSLADNLIALSENPDGDGDE